MATVRTPARDFGGPTAMPRPTTSVCAKLTRTQLPSDARSHAVGSAVGIDDVRVGVLPEAKAALVAWLQAEGHAVAVVGDGVNDAAALAGADLGMAVGRGTDTAIEAADVVLGRDDLLVVADAVRLARRTHATIRTTSCGFAYNVAALPSRWPGCFSPLFVGAAMALFWRWDVLFGTAAVLAAAGYLLGVRRLRRAGTLWAAAWTASWLAGCVVLLLAPAPASARTRPRCSACTWSSTCCSRRSCRCSWCSATG